MTDAPTNEERSIIESIAYALGFIITLPVTLFLLIAQFNVLTAMFFYVFIIGGAYFHFVKGY